MLPAILQYLGTRKKTKEVKQKLTSYLLIQIWGTRVALLVLPIIEREGE